MIRAVGPTMGALGVPDTVADPVLRLNTNPQVSIDDWSTNTTGTVGVSALKRTFDTTYAFQIDAATRGAVLLVTLDAGVYTAQDSSADGGTGVALVKVDEVR